MFFFKNGHLSEIVFMEQPPGFIGSTHPDYVCMLNKALYDLKQASRAWFQRLSLFLLQQVFCCSQADTSLFVFHQGSCILYLLVYVYDIIVTCNHESSIRCFIDHLHQEFAIKDLGKLNYFMGLQVNYTSDGLFLNQTKYAHDILVRASLLDAKTAATPLATNDAFLSSRFPYSNPTHYCSLVDTLQYLTISRPDLSYAVN